MSEAERYPKQDAVEEEPQASEVPQEVEGPKTEA